MDGAEETRVVQVCAVRVRVRVRVVRCRRGEEKMGRVFQEDGQRSEQEAKEGSSHHIKPAHRRLDIRIKAIRVRGVARSRDDRLE